MQPNESIKSEAVRKRDFLLQFITVLVILFVGFFPAVLFGYDFSDVRRSLSRDLEKWQGEESKNKIAIIYNNEKRAQIKSNYNLVRLKKDLSYELLKSFEIADPIIVQEILKNNNISYDKIAKDKEVLDQFVDRAGSDQVLLVDFSPKSSSLIVDLKLMNRDNTQISRVVTELSPEADEKVTFEEPIVSESKDSDDSFFGGFAFDLGHREFDRDHDESWLYFRPTAYVNPKTHSLDMKLWFKDISKVDIQIASLKYDLTLLELLQFGLQYNSIADKKSSIAGKANKDKEMGHHSTYSSLKYQIVGEDSVPFNLAIGIRYRLFFDSGNTDFRSRDEISDRNSEKYNKAWKLDDQHDRYDRLTMQVMVSGKIDNLGLMYSVYADNLTVSTGIKFLLTPAIKLFAENLYYYYEDSDINYDTAFGIQIYNKYGSTDFSYQVETEQTLLGLNLDF